MNNPFLSARLALKHEDWRVSLLQMLLLSMAVIALPILINEVRYRDDWLVPVLTWSVLPILFLCRPLLSHASRAYLFVVLFTLFGLWTSYTAGLMGGGRMWMGAAALLAALLLGARVGFILFFVATAALTGIGFSAVTGSLTFSPPFDSTPNTAALWASHIGTFVIAAGGLLLSVLYVIRAIEARKQAELALAKRERQLLDAQRMAEVGNWSADLVSGELTWSDEIYRIFGYEPGSITPSVAAFHDAVHPDDRERVRESEEKAVQTGRLDVIHRIVRPDGSIRHVHERAEMRLDEAGTPFRLSGTVQDVTERAEFEQALVSARQEADHANQAKTEFLSRMSHELRTPLNAILGFGQLLQSDSANPPSAAQRESIDEIMQAGRHLLGLVNEILDLSRIESGRIEVSLEPVDLAPVLEQCVSQLRPLADERHLTLSLAEGIEAWAIADYSRLRQVVLNLLSNAVKYNREHGKVELAVETTAEGRLRISVSDTGPGIDPAVQPALFRPFERLGGAYNGIEGTGIGLALCKHLVEAMGGEIGLESVPGEGSTFWVELPQGEPVTPGTAGTTD
ncbi:MAG: PAS domain-containing sensor histidine kinase [Pseudohaliea sp.]